MKHIFWITGLLVLLFAGDRAGGWLLQQLTDKSEFRYSRMYRGGVEADILLVGNSRGLMFYQPYIESLTGQTTLNLSYNALPMDLAHCLVEDHYRINRTPKQLVIDVTMCDRINNQLLAAFQPYRAYSECLEKLMFDKVPKSYYGGMVSNLYRFNSEIFHRALYYQNKEDEDWLLDRRIGQKMIDNLEGMDTNDFTIKPYLFDHLIETVKFAQSKGTEVHLVVNPYYPDYRRQRIINLDDSIAKIEAATGLTVHDYSTAVTDLDGFGDFQHLNVLGSKQYIDRLVADGLLAPKG